MSRFFEYRTADGTFTGKSASGAKSWVDTLAAEGLAWRAGEVDWHSQRVDLESGELVDYQPPAPADTAMQTWSWDAGIKRWIPSPTTAAHWVMVRGQRDELLRQSDWRTIRASDGGPPMSQAWKQYRQALRDITTQPDPKSIVWPTPPES